MISKKNISGRLVTYLLTAILLLPAIAQASFMGNATFSSVPPGARLEPVQILIDDNLSGGAGIANVVDNNASSPLGYFIVGRGEVNGTFPWMHNFKTDNQVFAQKMVRYKDYYFVLYTEYQQITTSLGAFLLQLDANTGAVINKTRLVFDNGATDITGVDLVLSDPYEMLYVVCNANYNGAEVNLLGAYDMRNNQITDARMIEFNGSNIHADALTKAPSSIGANDHLFIGGRARHTNYYEEVYVQSYLFDHGINQFVIFNHNVFQWSVDNRLFMSRLKYQESTGQLILAAQSWSGQNDAGNLELWQIDAASTSPVITSHYESPGRMFLSDINLDKETISLAGPNNRFNKGFGNVIAVFDYNTDFMSMNQYPFNGRLLEPTAMHGPLYGFPFVMAAQDGNNNEQVKWTVGSQYKGTCDVVKASLKKGDFQLNIYQALTEQQIPGFAKQHDLIVGREKLIYETTCGKPGKKESTGIGNVSTTVNPYTFAQTATEVYITTDSKLSNAILYDVNGRKVGVYETNGSTLSISKQNIQPGIYILSFDVAEKTKREKILVY